MPRHSTVAAYVALFASLGTGGAVAATTLSPNSVGSAQIRSHSIRLSDVSPATIRALKGKRGPVGPQGAAGATGERGLTGAAGASFTAANIVRQEVVRPAVTADTANSITYTGLRCSGEDERVLNGGGYYFNADGVEIPVEIFASYPNVHATTWGLVTGGAPEGARLHMFTICLKP